MSSTSTPPIPEIRAKRTHARRSCDVCKVRKTRCELPDLEIPASSDPLPFEKSCHRCKILALPCIVDDATRKQRKRPSSAEGGEDAPKAGRKSKTPKNATTTTLNQVLSAEHLSNIDHTLDVLQAQASSGSDANIDPGLKGATLEGDMMSLFAAGPAGVKMPSFESDEQGESDQRRTMKLMGRPLVIVSAMLRVACGKKASRRPGVAEACEVDIDKAVNDQMRSRLEPGFKQLRTFHSFLDPLTALFTRYKEDPSEENDLLVSLVVYLSSLVLEPAKDVLALRATIAPHIIRLRDTLLLSVPSSFVSLQALDLLALHAPLGVLPVQRTDIQTLTVARGHVFTSALISERVNFPVLVQHMRQVSRMKGTSGHISWDEVDNWIWLSLCAAEAAMALEDEVVRKPARLAEAMAIIDEYYGKDWQRVWEQAIYVLQPEEFIGRLGICDRLTRLSETIDSVVRIRGVLNTAAADPSLDVVETLNAELKYLSDRMKLNDQRHEAIMAMIRPSSDGIEAGLLAYRHLRRHFEQHRVHLSGVRMFMAVAFLPDHPLALPGLPEGLPTASRISLANSRMLNPPDIMAFCAATSNPLVQAVWNWGAQRGKLCEALLSRFSSIGSRLAPNSSTTKDANHLGLLIPLHDSFCVAVEAAKVLMEDQAGTILLRNAIPVPWLDQVPAWIGNLRRTRDLMRSVATLSSRPTGEKDLLQSVANGCTNLMASMIRLAEGWRRQLLADGVITDDNAHDAISGPGANSRSGSGSYPTALEDPSQRDGAASPSRQYNEFGMNSNSHDQYRPPLEHHHSHPSYPQGHVENGHAPHGPYMDSSDRWMASDSMPQGYAGAPAPTPLDLLLSHMFNYSSQVKQEPGTNGEYDYMTQTPSHQHFDSSQHQQPPMFTTHSHPGSSGSYPESVYGPPGWQQNDGQMMPQYPSY